MHHPVESLFYQQQSCSPIYATGRALFLKNSVDVIGDAIHVENEELIDRYRKYPLEKFLAHEARYSIGNFVTVESSESFCRIVTSPGYCGGYVYAHKGRVIVGTLLSTVLQAMKDDIVMDPFGLCFFLNYAPKNSFQQLPFTTMFRHIRRLPPASVLEIKNGKRTAHYSYLMKSSALPPPESFEDAINEVCDKLAAYYQRTRKTPALMFSGGVDSLVIYLSLRKKMAEKDLQVFTMNHSRTNGLERASPIADYLGFEIEAMSDISLDSTSINAALKEMMSKDIINSKGPHLTFIDRPIGGKDILHGQNMDAMFGVNMCLLNANLEQPYLSKEKVEAKKNDTQTIAQYVNFIGNLQFTEPYLNDVVFQRTTADFYAMLNKNTVLDPDVGGKGVFRGMLSSQFPNLLSPATYPLDQIEHLDNEVSLFKKYVGDAGLEPSFSLGLLRYYTYSALANKRVGSVPLPDGSRTLLVPMAGAITSYLMGKKRSLSVASHPKLEIYALAEKLTGKPYSKLFATKKPVKATSQAEIDLKKDSLMEENLHYLQPKNSKVLPAITKHKVRAHIEAIYSDALKSCDPKQEAFVKYH